MFNSYTETDSVYQMHWQSRTGSTKQFVIGSLAPTKLQLRQTQPGMLVTW